MDASIPKAGIEIEVQTGLTKSYLQKRNRGKNVSSNKAFENSDYEMIQGVP